HLPAPERLPPRVRSAWRRVIVAPPQPEPDDLVLITRGTLEVSGRLVDASNATLFCTVELDGRTAHAVYKPVAGERPLWDFPDGTLAGREVAMYEIAQHSGLG